MCVTICIYSKLDMTTIIELYTRVYEKRGEMSFPDPESLQEGYKQWTLVGTI